jgi:uncharacterized protein (TIGR02646 family)
MLKLPERDLPEHARETLEGYQSEINQAGNFAARRERAKAYWKNRRNNEAFDQVRAALTAMSGKTRRCHYCEDSVADEIEHIKPKDHYPEEAFVWLNYAYVCGACNIAKGDRFEVFSYETGKRVSVSDRDDETEPPEEGDPVFISPRREDPLDFIIMDLADTFQYLPTAKERTRHWERASFTIDVLKLNEKEHLLSGAKNVFHARLDILSKYIALKREGASESELNEKRDVLLSQSYPTVWEETKRLYRKMDKMDQTRREKILKRNATFRQIRDLFESAPEALTWSAVESPDNA